MKVIITIVGVALVLSSCVVNENFEQRVRSCDPSLAMDKEALLYHDKDYLNILMMASEVGCFSLVKSLVDKIDVNERTHIGTTALFSAVAGNNIKIVQFLIKKGVEVNATDNPSNVEALLFAVTQGEVQMVKILLDAGANPNRRGKQLKSTPIHYAVIGQRYALVELLLKYGADPTVKAKRLGTPLDIAKRKNDRRMIDLLRGKLQFRGHNT